MKRVQFEMELGDLENLLWTLQDSKVKALSAAIDHLGTPKGQWFRDHAAYIQTSLIDPVVAGISDV